MTRRLQRLGLVLAVFGLVFAAGGAYAFIKTQEGARSLEAFSAAQNVTLSYNEDGQLVDRGETAEAQAIMALLTDDWGYPVAQGDLNPDDPVVNTATEYMYQMATIAYHTLHGTQTVVLTADDLTGEDGTLATEYICNGETVAVPDPFPAEGVICDFQVDGRYWTGFDRTDPVQGKARDQAWSGTAHALVAELGVGAATHSTLQLALGVAALLAGLGVVCTVMGVAFIWETRRRSRLTIPDTIPEAVLKDTPLETANPD